MLTLTCISFTSGGRLETMILSAGCWLAAGATLFAPLEAGTARARVAGPALEVPSTCALPEFRRGFDLRMPLGRVAMILPRQNQSRRSVTPEKDDKPRPGTCPLQKYLFCVDKRRILLGKRGATRRTWQRGTG